MWYLLYNIVSYYRMLRGMLSDGPCLYRGASFLDLNPLWVVFPKREYSLPPPVIFAGSESVVSCGCGELPSVWLAWWEGCKSSPAYDCQRWLDQRWESGGPGGEVWRQLRVGYMRAQVALAEVEMSVKLECTGLVQDRTENPVIAVQYIN